MITSKQFPNKDKDLLNNLIILCNNGLSID